MTGHVVRRAVLAVLAVLAFSACDYQGAGSMSLPFTEGRGEDAIVVTVELENAANLVPNSEVKVGDVTVGSVRSIAFQDWHAEVVVGLNAGTSLPANAVARIGQKSLLGAEYLELAPAPVLVAARLESGATIPLARSGRYPETEEVLSALSTLLNGGGLANVRTITNELNLAMTGHEQDWRGLLHRLDTFVGGLDAQKADLVRALQAMNRLGGTLAGQRKVLEQALDTLPAGLGVLEQERPQLIGALQSVGRFGSALTSVVDRSQTNLVGTLHDLQPVLRELADAGKDLPEATGMLTFPFPVDRIVKIVRGDYANLFINVDVSLDRLKRSLLAGTPLEGLLGSITGAPPGTTTHNPLTAPLGLPDLPSLPDLHEVLPIVPPVTPPPVLPSLPVIGGLAGRSS
jgi:phospholipid/cholesterol/gamma-HCH transport system substrate-binding protein